MLFCFKFKGNYAFMRIISLYISAFFSMTSLIAKEDGSPVVWIDGGSYQSYLHTQGSATTLYFPKWEDMANVYLNQKKHRISLKLTDSFDPLPDDQVKLPGLKTLASLNNTALLEEYLEFLESYSRTKGYAHLVLPDTTGLSLFEKEVIKKANDMSPLFFLNSYSISSKVPRSKKQFLKLSQNPVVWVTQQNTKVGRLSKWINKNPNASANLFFHQLKRGGKAFAKTPHLDKILNKKILEQAIAAVDPSHQLPIRKDTIVYLGDDFQFKYWLSKYVTVMDSRVPRLPVILDLRNQQAFDHLPGDIVIIENNQANYSFTTSSLIIPDGLDEDILLTGMLFGAKGISGRYPVSGSRTVPSLDLVGYASPNHEGLDENHLRMIDMLAHEAIQKMATPGCQVAVLRNGALVMEKSYGYLTYDSLQEVTNETVYDVASLTKVAATLPAIALLVDQGKISLDDSISHYLPSFLQSNKSGITIRQLLAHNGGLKPYIPFWKRTMDGDRLDVFYYRNAEDEANDVRSYGIEPSPRLADSLKSWIVSSSLIKNPKKYKYSDIGFMILHLIVEKVSGMGFEPFVVSNFYSPMALKNTFFNPAVKGVSFRKIAPTEYDRRYRNAQVWGEVHDRNAYVFGGAAGHAGLFSNASDLATIMYMYLNDGYYGGWQYLTANTINHFNARHFEKNRRGLGWDKKGPGYHAPSALASDESFGHTGFTGTMVWADPKENLVFVFLSNRPYPNADNWKIGYLNTRSQIHDIIHQSILFH